MCVSRSFVFIFCACCRSHANISKLDIQGGGLALGNVRGVGLDGSSDLGGGELLHLLRSAAHKGGRIQEVVQLWKDGVEERCAANPVKKVVVLAMFLDVVGSLVGENT